MKDLVSVVICTHNRINLVERAIDSALGQKDVSIEVIVVDDCSEDGTLVFLEKKYRDQINVVSTGANSGRAVGTNLGVEKANGEYIALLDDDDYWMDELKISKQLERMVNDPTLGVLGTWWVKLEKDGVLVDKMPVPPRNRYLLLEKLLMGGGVISGSSPLISCEAWDQVGGMDVKKLKGIDSDLYRRIAFAGYDIDVLEEVTTCADVSHEYARMTPVTSFSNAKRAIYSELRVLKKHHYVFLLYPRALVKRVISLARKSWRLFVMTCRGYGAR